MRTALLVALALLGCGSPPTGTGERPAPSVIANDSDPGAAPSPASDSAVQRVEEPTTEILTSASGEEERQGEVLRLGGEVERPRRKSAPAVSELLRERFATNSFRGPCIVRGVVSHDGHLGELTFLKPEDCAEEVKSALLDHLSLWEYEPARLDEEPVAVYLHFSVGHCPCYGPAS